MTPLPRSPYRQNRERYLERLADRSSAALFATGSPPTRNNDCEYRFRPHSDFWYLTGFAEPDCVLLLLPGHSTHPSVLFLRERDPQMETWNGRRLGVERAAEELGVDLALPIDALWTELPELLEGYERLVYRTGEDEQRDREMLAVLGLVRGRPATARPSPTRSRIPPARCTSSASSRPKPSSSSCAAPPTSELRPTARPCARPDRASTRPSSTR